MATNWTYDNTGLETHDNTGLETYDNTGLEIYDNTGLETHLRRQVWEGVGKIDTVLYT